MPALPLSEWRCQRSKRAIALVLIALGCANPCHAGVFAIDENGAVEAVGAVEAPSTVHLVAHSEGSSTGSHITRPDTTAATPSPMTSIPSRFASIAARAAEANDLAPDLLAAVVWQESRWRPDAVSHAGAIGLGQLMPATADGMRINPRDPVANLYGAAHYLRQQLDRFDGNVELALAAYNSGPARVLKAGGVPPIFETRSYVAAIMDRLSAIPTKGN